MDALKIVRVRKALGLKRDMVGVRFIPYKKEYDLSEAEERRHVALLVEYADMVTEMREVRHPFRFQQIPAQKGIDF